MKRLTDIALGMKIWLRLVIVIWLMIALAWSGMLLWTFRLQRQIAMEQAQDFAVSVHQMTLAGLTGMMITGTVGDRAIFLEQIRQSNSIRSLRVVRGAAVMRQYGTGTVLEPPADAQERLVLGTGQPLYELRQDERGNILRAVLPVVAQINYLGKDCLGCHDVRDGATLGAISMEISLQKMDAAMKDFAARTSIAAIFICLSLLLVLYLSLSRSVTRPLRAMTRGLDRIATGEIEPDQRLPVRGADEIAEASAAFNRVMEKVAHMLADERIAVDVFNHALEGIMVADRDARILKVNPAFTRTTGYSAEEAIGQTPKILQSGQQDAAFYQAFWRALTTVGEWQGDIWNRRKNGEIYPEWLNISCARNDAGEVEYYIAIFSDITERKRQEALITYQGYHDALTGLPNRTLFKDRLEQALAVARRQGEQAVAVMFLDLTMPVLDGFGVLEALRKEDMNSMVIVVSADIQPVAQERVMSMGAIAFVKKPVSAELISNVLKQYGVI